MEVSNITREVYTHEASMDIGFLPQGSPHSLINLLPKVQKRMHESSWSINISYSVLMHKKNIITCDCSKR